MQNIDKLSVKTKIFQKNVITFINIYKVKIRIRDDVAREHVFTQIFYAFLKVFQNVIVKLSWMMTIDSHVDWTTLIWRFEINLEKITIQFFKDISDFNNKVLVYALMCSTFNVEITSKMRKLFEFWKSIKIASTLRKRKPFSSMKTKITLLIWFPTWNRRMNRFIFFFKLNSMY